MTQTATDLSAEFMDEDLRGLALILDYAHEQARKLAMMFHENFQKYTEGVPEEIRKAGPKYKG